MERRGRAFGFWVGVLGWLWAGAFAHTPGEWSAHALRLHEMAVAINRVRVAHGLPPLKLNAELCRAAQWMSDEILLTGRFGHVDSAGRRADARARMVGYEFEWLGENLAAGQSSLERALQAWLNSPSHRENLLHPAYRELGLGYTRLEGSRYGFCWAQLLGARREVYPLIINLDAPLTDTPEVELYIHGAEHARLMRLSNDGIAWSEWHAPAQRFRWRLPHEPGFHTVYVQLLIGERVYEASDTIYLCGEPSTSRAIASTNTTDAPACLSASAQASKVLPVVNTSSSSRTRHP